MAQPSETSGQSSPGIEPRGCPIPGACACVPHADDQKSPVQDALTALPSEDEIAALIREHAVIGYQFLGGGGGGVDAGSIRVSGAHAAASMILHRVKQALSPNQ